MASTKERARWDRMWSVAMARLRRQQASITRLVESNTILSAALFELAEGDVEPGSVAARARRAIEEAAAAAEAVTPESVEFKEPTEGEADAEGNG